MLTFLYPFYFLLIIPIIILVVFLYKKSGNKILFGPIEDLKKIYKGRSLYFKIYYLLLFIILSLFVVIISRPVEENVVQKIKKDGVDIEIVLDLSYSMTAKDLEPNRLEVAKDVITQFIESRKTDRVGIIVFAGKPFKSLPLNFDYNIIKKIVSKIDIETINQNIPSMQGTALGDALIVASDAFDDEPREKIIILLTDGEANRGVHPEIALNYIKEQEKGIKIYTVGIGGLEPTSVTITNPYGQTQQLPIGGVDEKSLQLLAEKTGGKYFRATDKETFEDIFKTIGELEKKEIEVDIIKNTEDKNMFFLYVLYGAMFLFLIIKWRKKI